ncbi:hypothetical protein B0H14DRAFT_2646831 [Mycena olivaceomarginata]|nr:hypothetical protein B0H14DRAFT_2646831 [Mycena olivaceomarginata]
MPEMYGAGESDSRLRILDSPRESVKCELVGTSLDSKQIKYLVTYCPNDQESPEDGHEADERDEVQNEIILETEPVWMTPESISYFHRAKRAVDLETGIPEAKTQSSKMQDFSEPGLNNVESGKLQKSAEAAIGQVGLQKISGEEELSSVLVDSKDGSVVRIWGVRVKQKVDR